MANVMVTPGNGKKVTKLIYGTQMDCLESYGVAFAKQQFHEMVLRLSY